MRKSEVLGIIDEVMNNREVSSIRNAILAIRNKVLALTNEDNEGEWSGEGGDDGCKFICSKCDALFFVTRGYGKMNFCPNCGADMRRWLDDDGT